MEFTNCTQEDLGYDRNILILAMEKIEEGSTELSIEARKKEEDIFPIFILHYMGKEYSVSFNSYRKEYHFSNIYKLPAPFNRVSASSILTAYGKQEDKKEEPNRMKSPRFNAVKKQLEYLDWERGIIEDRAIPHFLKIYTTQLEKVERISKLPTITRTPERTPYHFYFNSNFFEYSFDFSNPLYVAETLEFKRYKLSVSEYENFMTHISEVNL